MRKVEKRGRNLNIVTRIAKRLIEKRAIEGRLERSKEAMQIFRENISRAFFFFYLKLITKVLK